MALGALTLTLTAAAAPSYSPPQAVLVRVAVVPGSVPPCTVTVMVFGLQSAGVKVARLVSVRTLADMPVMMTVTVPVGARSRDSLYVRLAPGAMLRLDGETPTLGGLASVTLSVSAAIPSTLYPSPCTSWVMSTVRVPRLLLYGVVRVTVALGLAAPAWNRITVGDAFTPEPGGTRTVTATEDSGTCPSRNSYETLSPSLVARVSGEAVIPSGVLGWGWTYRPFGGMPSS